MRQSGFLLPFVCRQGKQVLSVIFEVCQRGVFDVIEGGAQGIERHSITYRSQVVQLLALLRCDSLLFQIDVSLK